MPAIGNVVLADGAATPVNHTFGPISVDGTLATWTDRSGGIPVGNPKLSIALRDPQGPSGVYKVTVKVLLPVLEATSPSTSTGIQPAPTVGYTMAMHADFLLPARSTVQNRKDILAYAKNLFTNALMNSVVVDLENVY
jgi:hypothetical protein